MVEHPSLKVPISHGKVTIIISYKNSNIPVSYTHLDVYKRQVIATLSHDIKTPIASIRGYAEALVMNMDATQERRERYASVIMKKCDEVTSITNDMFIHSLHDLDRLVVKRCV